MELVKFGLGNMYGWGCGVVVRCMFWMNTGGLDALENNLGRIFGWGEVMRVLDSNVRGETLPANVAVVW